VRVSRLNGRYFDRYWSGTKYDDPECRTGGELDLGLHLAQHVT
jgi:hypothetical protein